MTRVLPAAALAALAALAGYLAGGAARPPAPRAPVADLRVSELEARVAALERRRSAAAPAGERALPAEEERVVVERAVDPEQQRGEWLQRLRDADAPEKSLAVLRDAHAQIKRHEGPESLRRFLEEVVGTTDPRSDVHFEATMLLAYDARGAGDYARADELIHRVMRTVPRDDARFAEAQYQLAWNRKYAGDPAGADHYFRAAAEAPGAPPLTKTAAWYNVAHIRAEAADRTGAAEICRRLLEDRDTDLFYARATKTLLASVESK